ncbi:unnamed protein product [Ophioblennius macclurei]
MLEDSEPRAQGSMEVAVVPEERLHGEVGGIHKAELAPGGALLACLEVGGQLVVQSVGVKEAPPAAAVGHYTDFSWEEAPPPPTSHPPARFRLLAVGSQLDLNLLEVEAEPDVSGSLRCMCELSAERLLQTCREENPSVCELQSVRLLGFAAGVCLVLLNSDHLLQLQWHRKSDAEEEDEYVGEEEEEAEKFQIVSSCRVEMADSDTAVHHCVCRETLFILRSTGLISVHDISAGRLLASVDLPSYFSSGPVEDELTSSLSSSSSSPLSSSSFCLLQVAEDLSTAVAVTQSHTAVAVDLHHYFRTFPAHLLCATPTSPASVRPPQTGDQDTLLNSSGNLAGLRATFSTNWSWEARLASMYNKAQSSPTPPDVSGRPWWSWLPHLESHLAPPSAHTRVPPGGATATFAVPELAAPSQLTVSEFSALLTFVAPGNKQTNVALWEMKSQSVSYHRAEGEAAPVQRCGERQHRLLLRKTGVFQVLFGLSQQELLSRLMLFGSAATVDAVCHLNNWGRCSIPIHALQGGLKNRQLDTVDFYLKSKENILQLPAAEPSAASTPSLTNVVQELCPALDMLCSAVRESHGEAQSRQFSEQLLNITLSFIYMQIRTVLSSSHYENSDVQSCVDVLDRYVTQLRRYMKRFPWSAGSNASSHGIPPQEDAQQAEWARLPVEEVVHQAILSNQIPRAQAALRRRKQPEQILTALRTQGLQQVLGCLQRRDLQTANTLLTNMGFSVKKQLHSICLYTDDKELRELMVEELLRHDYFPKEEMQSVEFIREMEKLGSLPAFRCRANATSRRVPRMHGVEGRGEELLKQAVGRSRLEDKEEEEAGLWRNLRLDWVKNWDQNSRTAVSLSRLQLSELTACDSSVLWHYLTSLHDQCRIVEWIQDTETSGSSKWPKLSPELVDNNTACSVYMRENILDLLARRGVFVPTELSDQEQLLWRLAQGGGLMASSPPIPQHRSAHGLDLHGIVITFCLQQKLHYFLYTYLKHYRLTPRNCPLLSGQNLSETEPWFEMLVKIQEITRDFSDPGLVFQASLTIAQVLLPGSQPSLSSLLLEGHSLLALAAIMFAPGGVDQVMAQGERLGRSERAVDPQLLKLALASHPKLKAALFPPSGPRGSSTPSDVSVYHLLQSLHPLDPSRLFGWQAANTLNYTETSELPHFSSPHLVSRFALVENLDFLFYLRHGRPSFAYATFIVQQLGSCSDVKPLLLQASQQVFRLALQCFNLPSVTSAAICFCELLGLCSLKLRVDIRAMNTILQHWNQQNTPAGHLQALGVKLVEAELEAADELIGYLEAAVTDIIDQKGISRSSYEAAQEWVLPVQFCQLHGRSLSSVYPAHCAQDRQFIHFLLFVQLHNFPPQQVRALVAQFDPTLEAHLSLAFQDLQVYSQRSGQDTEEQQQQQQRSARNKSTAATLRPERPRELFQVLLESQEESAPCTYLLQEALMQRCPTLAVLAVCLQEAKVLQCLCVWVLSSIDAHTATEATAHLPVACEHHEWTLHDLSIIWKTLLERGHVQPLLRGFELFQRGCPLVLVLRMFELCCDYRNFTEAKSNLLDFQRTLVALRNGAPASEDSLPLQWVESQASVLLLTMLQRCSSQYDRHRLLQLLTDVDKLLKSNGPDFRKLSQLSQLLQGTEVSLSPRFLQCSTASVQQEEFQAVVDTLQTKGLYGKARQVALLAGLPIHLLLLSQLHQEVSSQKSRRQWGRLETRVTFWRKCHNQLKADGSDPTSASSFFLSQAESSTAQDPLLGPGLQTELPDLQERSLLLSLAAHWLSLLDPAPLERLESLERELWMCRVREHALSTAMEKESVFNFPPDTSTYDVLMKEFSFSNISDLNRDKCLSLEGLPRPHTKTDSRLSLEERSALTVLIGQLLDTGKIHEASRVSRYFSLHHPDLWVVLCCRGLASGELDPETLEEAAEGPERRGIPTSHSFSSLSSFVMLPEDDLAVRLQRLSDQCRHGSNYCKQILGLHQLSKELQCSFSQICSEEPRSVLERLLQSEQSDRFRKAQVFIKAQGLSADVVAQLISSSVIQGLISSAQELQPVEKQVFRPSEGRDSLMQLIKLCEDPNLVGVKLLENLNAVPQRDLSCIVELLIVAHNCFSLTCNMEGIVRVLQAARHLSHTFLSPGEHHSLLVRLLTGIGRYNEMTYVFDLLHHNHCFEMLLRKKEVESERGQSSSLKTALLDYIKRCLPADSEKHNMVALCFSMRREIGENHEIAARTQLKIIESQAWVVTPELKGSLMKVLNLLKDAAESFAKDSCVRQASRCVRTAKLVTLQLHFLNQGSDLRIINLHQPAELQSTVLALPRCYQVFVVSEAYSYNPDWADIIYQKVVLNGDFSYLEEFKQHRPLSSGLFEDIFRKVDGAPSSAAPNMKRLLSHCDDVYSRYKLAYQQNLCDITKALLQDSKTSNYLNDRLAS